MAGNMKWNGDLMDFQGMMKMGRNEMSKDPLSQDIIPEGYEMGQMSRFTPEQLKLFRQLFSTIGPESDIFKMASGDQSFFDQMEAPAHRQFQEQMGGLASRFSGMQPGAMSARGGSGFQNQATQGAADFTEKLRSNRTQMSQQALQQLMQMAQMMFGQQPVEKFMSQQQPEEDMAQNFGRLFGMIPGLGAAAAGHGTAGGAVKGATSIFGGGSSLNAAGGPSNAGFNWS